MLGLKELLAQPCWVSKSSFEPEQVQNVRERTDPSKVPSLAQRNCLQGKTRRVCVSESHNSFVHTAEK